MPLVSCIYCHKSFSAKSSWLKQGWGKYCSAECQHADKRKGKEVPCAICGTLVYRKPRYLKLSKSGKFFCSKTCQTRWRNQLYIGEKHKNFKTGEFVYRGVMERNKVPKVCRLCKTTDYRVLAVHHIDKNRKNNKVENLAYLCNNCHFLVHHYEDERKKFMAPMV